MLLKMIRSLLDNYKEEAAAGAVTGLVLGFFGWWVPAISIALGFLVIQVGAMVLAALRNGGLGRYSLAYTIAMSATPVALMLTYGLVSAILH